MHRCFQSQCSVSLTSRTGINLLSNRPLDLMQIAKDSHRPPSISRPDGRTYVAGDGWNSYHIFNVIICHAASQDNQKNHQVLCRAVINFSFSLCSEDLRELSAASPSCQRWLARHKCHLCPSASSSYSRLQRHGDCEDLNHFSSSTTVCHSSQNHLMPHGAF